MCRQFFQVSHYLLAHVHITWLLVTAILPSNVISMKLIGMKRLKDIHEEHVVLPSLRPQC